MIDTYINKLEEFGFTGSGSDLILKKLFKIESKRLKGTTYAALFDKFVYSDCPLGSIALLAISEVQHKTKITSSSQWAGLCQINDEQRPLINHAFTLAMEARYLEKLRKILKRDKNYEKMIKINPATFYLPERWIGITGETTTKHDLVNLAISMQIEEVISPHIKIIRFSD